MKRLRSTNGQYFFVDDADYEAVQRFKWRAVVDGNTTYINRATSTAERMAGMPRTLSLHRQLMLQPPGYRIDHINGNGRDNRRENLRVCTVSENAANAKLSKRNKTGTKGLTLQTICGRQYWVAEVSFSRERNRCVRAKREDAEEWLRVTRDAMHGTFANHGR